MNEDPPGLPWWKQVWRRLCNHTVDLIVGGIALGLVSTLGVFSGQLWHWLLDSIQARPGETLLLALTGISVFSVGKWLLWRRIANLEMEKSLKADRWKSELEAEKRKVAKMEAATEAAAKPTDPLSLQLKQIVTCILGAGEVSVSDIANEFNINEPTVRNHIHTLCYTFQFTVRVDLRDGIAYYGLTPAGEAYAAEQGIVAVDQKIGDIRRAKEEAANKVKPVERKIQRSVFTPIGGSAETKPAE